MTAEHKSIREDSNSLSEEMTSQQWQDGIVVNNSYQS